MERVADYVIRKVNEAGAKHIFMITGRGILYLTDAVAKNKNICSISTYHEQGASYAAMAYAAAKSGVAACLVSTGCAGTNAVTACLCSYQDNLPVVFISGNNPLMENTRHTGIPIRTYGSQETDIISIVSPCTKYAVMLENDSDVVYEVEKAIYIAQNGRKGPVWIDVPLDVQNRRIDAEKLKHFTEDIGDVDGNLVSKAHMVAEELNQAKRPILLIGGGCKEAGSIIKDFVCCAQIPVAFSPAACDVYGTAHSLSIGAVGSIGGSRAGNFAVQNADYILAVGTRLSSQLTGVKKAFARCAKITVVDIDEYEHTKDGVHIYNKLRVDATEFFMSLLHQKIFPVNNEWKNKCIHWKTKFVVEHEEFVVELQKADILDIYIVANILSSNIPANATLITDAGFEELIIPSTIQFRDEQRCLFPATQGAMGYAIPAIIGAHVAGRKNIFCIVGDGSFMMNMQELGLIMNLSIPAKIFVINNNMYAVIRKRQTDLFRNRTIGNDPSDGLPAPVFSKIADSVGMEYRRIETISSFRNQIGDILQSDNAMLIEVICVDNQKYLHESYSVNGKRRIVHRPIEDMAPFLDRDVIRNEMIIDMVEE